MPGVSASGNPEWRQVRVCRSLADVPKGLRAPMKIVASSDRLRARIGGSPPAGVNTLLRNATLQTRYFATFPLDSKRDASVFLSFTFDTMLNFAGVVNAGTAGGVILIEAVVHHPRPRASDEALRSELSERSLQVLAPTKDIVELDAGPGPSPDHKLGGEPWLHACGNPRLEELRRLSDEGFAHFAQIDFPGAEDDGPSGDWPFGDGIFNLFVSLGHAPSWRYLWRLGW